MGGLKEVSFGQYGTTTYSESVDFLCLHCFYWQVNCVCSGLSKTDTPALCGIMSAAL